MSDEEQITEEQAREQVNEIIRQFNSGKDSVHSFFTNVIVTSSNDSIAKIGNLGTEELGMSKHPVRAYKELALFSRDICKNKVFASFFEEMAKISLTTSLSKDGFLLKQVGTKRSEVADLTPKEIKRNSGMFTKKKPEEGAA